MLTLEKYNETYLINFPFIRIEGVLYGAPYIELDKHTYIHCSNGYTSKIDYAGKGYFSGKKNSFKATLSKGSRVLHTVSGVWSEKSVIGEGEKPKTTVSFLDAKETPFTNIEVAPIEQQGEWESRKLWNKVANAIRAGDMNLTTAEKSKIENSQRELRKKEQAEGTSWQRKYFQLREPDESYKKLATEISLPIETRWIFTGNSST